MTLDPAPRLSSLDALRGWAILGVIAIHAGIIVSPNSDWLRQIIEQGGRGVELFYLVSAFSLMHSLTTARDAGRPLSLSNYAVRRILRIGPMWWLTIVLYCWLNRYTLDWHVVLLSATFTHGFHHRTLEFVPGGWSIAVEAMFYCVLPLIFVYVTNVHRAVALVIGGTAASYLVTSWIIEFLMSNGVAREHAAGFAEHLSFAGQFPVFCIGILIFFVWLEAGRPQASWGVGLILLGLITTLMASRLDSVFIFHNITNYGVGLGLIVLGVVICPIVLLDNPVIRHIGKVSYSIYLLHFLVILVIGKLLDRLGASRDAGDAAYLMGAAVLLALATGVATLTYKFVEEPFMRLSRRSSWVSDRTAARDEADARPRST